MLFREFPIRLAVCVLATTLLTLTSSAAFAQEHSTKSGQDHAPAARDSHAQTTPDEHGAAVSGTHGNAAHGNEHAAAEAKPSLFAGDLGNVIFTLLIFLILLTVLGKFAWKPILNALKEREKFIHDSIAKARHEREEAEKLMARYQQQVERARVDATAIVDEGRRDAEEVRRRIQEEARKEADEMIARARREIELAGKDAIKRLYDQTAELSVQVASRVLAKTLTADEHRRLLNESLERVKSAGDGRLN